MKNQLTFNKFAATLAALGATTLTASAALASPVQMTETSDSVDGSSSELGDEKKDEKKDDKKDDKKKKKKDDGDEGGCGAGTCG